MGLDEKKRKMDEQITTIVAEFEKSTGLIVIAMKRDGEKVIMGIQAPGLERMAYLGAIIT